METGKEHENADVEGHATPKLPALPDSGCVKADENASGGEKRSIPIQPAELLLVHQLKLICVLKGSLRNCYADVLSQLQKLQVVSEGATNMPNEEFETMFRHYFHEQTLESDGKPANAFWRGISPSRFEADLESLGVVGEDSFRIIHKCKSKLDKQTYAVKIVDILEGSKRYEARILAV